MPKSFIYFTALAASALIGCGRSPYELAPVHGTIKLNEKTLPQGAVMFAPVAKGENANPGKPAVGVIQADGTYKLTTFEENDGAIVGEHWVTIVNHDEENLPDGVPEFARIQVPVKKVVESGKQNQIDIILSRDDVRKYREDDR
jgi:hypothetical protein